MAKPKNPQTGHAHGERGHCPNYLSGRRIEPVGLGRRMSVEGLVGLYQQSGSFNGGRLGEAAKLYSRMIDDDATIGFTVSGAMTPAGMGGVLIALMEAGLLDFLICTGANLYHDLHFALDLPVHQGDFRTNDVDLFEAGVVRIYDIFITEKLLIDTDVFVRDVLREARRQGLLEGQVSTSRVHKVLGDAVARRTAHPEMSVVATAARLGVPIYTSSPGDSSIGMNLAAMRLEGDTIEVAPDLDVLETTALVMVAKKNGVVEIGGGSPKNFYLQTQPTLSQILNIDRGGHDFFIQITTDSPQWGGLSGATPGEAVTWGKINPDDPGNAVVVYSDATIALPILAGYALSRHKRKLKRLLTVVPQAYQTLVAEAAKARRRSRQYRETAAPQGRGH